MIFDTQKIEFSIAKKKKRKSSDDHSLPPSASFIQMAHMSPTHHIAHQHYHPTMQSQTAQITVPQSNLSNTSTVSNAMSSSSTSACPEEFYTANEFNELGQSEHYIYVTYPPELKRRLLERYGREIYLMLLKKDFQK